MSPAFKQSILHQANNILGSLGYASKKDDLVKRVYTSKELIIEDEYLPLSIADTCQLAHDNLIGKECKDANYALKIFSKEKGTSLVDKLRFELGFPKKTLQFQLVYDGSSFQNIHVQGMWESILSKIASEEKVKYHPLPPAGFMYVCG